MDDGEAGRREAPVEADAVRDALRLHVLAGLRAVALPVSLLFVLFAVADGRLVGPGAATVVAADVGVAVLLGACAWALHRGRVLLEQAHSLALGVAVAVLANVALTLHVTRSPMHTMGLALVQLGAASIFLSWPALAVVLTAATGAWLAIAWRAGFTAGWAEAGLVLAATTVLATALQATRERTLTRLHRLSLDDQRRQVALGRALATTRHATQRLRASEERLRRVADASFEGICIHDGVRVRDVNRALAALLGKAPEDLVGQPVLDLVAPPLRDRFGQVLLVPDGVASLHVLRADGVPVPVEVRSRPLDDGALWVLAVRDTTPQQRAEAAAELAGERLRELQVLRQVDELKTRFLNLASHELRTPLTPMMIQVDVLRRAAAAPGAPQVQRSVAILGRNLERLARIVDDVLEAGRIQAGRLVVRPRAMDVEALAHDAVAACAPAAAQAGVAVELRQADGVWAHADPERVRHVLDHVLANAVRFTPRGGRVEVRVQREAGAAVVVVGDTGIGIAADDLPRLFQPFTQVHDPLSVTEAGSGLGLHICRGLLELQGGSIEAASPGPGQGTTVTVRLPADGSSPAPASHAGPGAQAAHAGAGTDVA